jgi:hypothetical protein
MEMPGIREVRERALPLLHLSQGMEQWSAPAAVRMALATRLGGTAPTQWELAQDDRLRTESLAGAVDRAAVRDVLNRELGVGRYRLRLLGDPVTAEERGLFRADLVELVDGGWPIVAGFLVRPGGPRPPGYPAPETDGAQHVVAFYGYADGGEGVLVADPAAGAAALSWSADVAPTYRLATDTATELMRAQWYVA